MRGEEKEKSSRKWWEKQGENSENQEKVEKNTEKRGEYRGFDFLANFYRNTPFPSLHQRKLIKAVFKTTKKCSYPQKHAPSPPKSQNTTTATLNSIKNLWPNTPPPLLLLSSGKNLSEILKTHREITHFHQKIRTTLFSLISFETATTSRS